MSEKKKKGIRIGKLILENAVRFLFSVLFIVFYQAVFGMENILPGVAISVALTMYPCCNLSLKPLTMVGIIFTLFVGSGAVAQLAFVSPWIALPFNFLFVLLIMALTCEPIAVKPSVCFLLSFVFCQASPVAAHAFPMRMASLIFGSLLVSAAVLVWWRRKGFGKDGRSIQQQMRLCLKHRGYILRMAAGISLAMLAGMLLGLKKPLWISIVAMSLTQLELHQTVQRIKHRTLATVVGILFFVLVFRILVPEQYSYAMVLLLGYLSFFTPEYKYKQVVNAISAINASLVLLDTTTAITNRCLCLLGGIVIVLSLQYLQRLFCYLRETSWGMHLPQVFMKKRTLKGTTSALRPYGMAVQQERQDTNQSLV